MATIGQWKNLFHARMMRQNPPLSNRSNTNLPILLDTAMGSENSGDFIIMDACSAIADSLFGGSTSHIATHYPSEALETMEGWREKILCGTNILYSDMSKQEQWALPQSLVRATNVCLLGVGMSDIGIDKQTNAYTSFFYHTILSKSRYHSVRDELTKRRLESIGIKNVLNTACPTMWALTDEAQARIPQRKASTVITSITDYAFSPEADRRMLGILAEEYEKVIIWVQGSHDVDWCLSKIIDLDKFKLIGPNTDDLNSCLKDPDIDYVGTRLHAGIRCLNKGHRSLIVTVDNRARQIGKDTGLPTIERMALFDGGLENWINNPKKNKISLPLEAINKWKDQWSLSKGLSTSAPLANR